MSEIDIFKQGRWVGTRKPRPDWVYCIANNHADSAGKAWCGAELGSGFHFTSLDHAAQNGRNQGRLQACPDCSQAALKALDSGTYQDRFPNGDTPC